MQKQLFDRIQREPLNPQHTYHQFVMKYRAKNDGLLNAYIEMSDMRADYFPKDQIDPQIIQILNQQPIFSARVLLIAGRKRQKLEDTQFQPIVSNQNKVYKRICKLKNEYQQRYLTDIGYVSKVQARQFNFRQHATYQNYLFYSTQRVDTLHIHEKDYKYLEDRHDYIQWMFPNHYQSMFNSSSFPMSYLQVELFKKSRYLGQKMLKSVHIFFDFLGLKLDQNFGIEIIDRQRLKQAVIINCHNHLRLRRILACLSIIGFRHIALSLIKFLGELVRSKSIYSQLSRTFQRQWEIYSNKNIMQALQLCFHPEAQFPIPHFIFDIQKILKCEQTLQSYDEENINKFTEILKGQSRYKNYYSKKMKISSFDSSSQQDKKVSKTQTKEMVQINKNEVQGEIKKSIDKQDVIKKQIEVQVDKQKQIKKQIQVQVDKQKEQMVDQKKQQKENMIPEIEIKQSESLFGNIHKELNNENKKQQDTVAAPVQQQQSSILSQQQEQKQVT